MATVSEVLTAATDSVTLINAINTDASAVDAVEGLTQAEINAVVQRNVDHLEIILEYAPVDSDDDTPNVKGSSSSKKTTCSTAITTGKAYIAAN
jgi:hypothetical protein|tara:strand:- start:314 stop:595 length:282 start_codon:yes stop_codon:yes gene_type:complete